MAGKRLLLWFSVLLVAALILLWLLQTGAQPGSKRAEPLNPLAAVAAQVNDINQVQVVTADADPLVSLRRIDGVWQVDQEHGYRADWSVLGQMLEDLAEAKPVEAKTANSDHYARLGVEPVTQAGAAGVLLKLSAAAGPAVEVIIGKPANARNGQYIRLADQAQSWLIDRRLVIPQQRSGWLSRDVIDIPASQVASVALSQDGQPLLEIEKASDTETDFTLLNIPPGRQAADAWTINNVASALSGLRMDAVLPQTSLDWSGAKELTLITFSGLTVQAKLLEREAQYWITLEATADGADENVQSHADEINKRVRDWAYRVPQYKYESMNKTQEDLLAAAAVEATTGGE